MSEKTIYDILADPNDTDNVVLTDIDGEETEFEQIATIVLEDETYCILSPLDENGVASDEGWVFCLKDSEEQQLLELVTDEEIIDKVFGEYERLCED